MALYSSAFVAAGSGASVAGCAAAAPGGPRDGQVAADAEAGGLDGGSTPDSGTDAGDDASLVDAGPLLARVALVSPAMGEATGTAHPGAPVELDARRPTFRWEEVEGAERYEIEIDDSCASPGACAFPSPELRQEIAAPTRQLTPSAGLAIAATAPVGRRYFWRVRACDAHGCGPYSEQRYLDVARQRSDFNGDGYADLAIGAPGVGAGRVYILPGAASFATVGEPGRLIALPPSGGSEGEGCGRAVAPIGDFDGDGFADLAMGCPEANAGAARAGRVEIVFGDAAWSWTRRAVIAPAQPSEGDRFGQVLQGAGDVDGDGFPELLIGVPGRSLGGYRGGAVFLVRGGEAPPSAADLVRFDNPVLHDAAENSFGAALAAGDLDGDGRYEWIVGAPQQRSFEAREGVAFVYGAASLREPRVPLAAIAHPSHEREGGFGASLAVMDQNADGFRDLVVGAPATDSLAADSGAVFVFDGRRGFDTSYGAGIRLDPPEGTPGARCGVAVASVGRIYDFPPVRFADSLLVSCAGLLGEPNIVVYFGRAMGIRPTDYLPGDGMRTFLSDTAGFAEALGSPGDLNGDGRPDFAVSMPSTAAGSTPRVGSVVLVDGQDLLGAFVSRGPIGPITLDAPVEGAEFGAALGAGLY